MTLELFVDNKIEKIKEIFNIVCVEEELVCWCVCVTCAEDVWLSVSITAPPDSTRDKRG